MAADGSSRCLDQDTVSKRKNAARMAASAVNKLEAELEQLHSEKEVNNSTSARQCVLLPFTSCHASVVTIS